VKQICAALGVLLLASPVWAADDSAMKVAAEGFYATYAAIPHDGVPDDAAVAKLRPHLAPGLVLLIEQASAAQDRFEQMTKNREPPLIEGDIYTSLFEGASSYSIGACSGDANNGRCAVSLVYSNPPAAPVTWTDTLYLTNTSQGWKVSDVGYGGTWPFGNKGKLSQTLQMAIIDAGD